MKLKEQQPTTEDKEIWTVRRKFLGEYSSRECVSRIIKNHINK